MRRAKGSITIFASISIMLIGGFLLALAEASRVCEINKICKIDVESEIESVFAQYNTPLWETYHLLAFSTDGEGSFEKLGQEVVERSGRSLCASTLGNNYLRIQPLEAEFSEYAFLADAKGAVFYEAAASYMKNNLAEEGFKEFYSIYEATQEIVADYEGHESAVEQAKLAIADAKQSTREDGDAEVATTGGVDHSKAIKPEIDPFVVEQLLSEDNLTFWVLEDPFSISSKRVEEADALSFRYYDKQSFPSGTREKTYEVSFWDEMLVNQYLISQMSSYCNVKEGRALDYELEHIIAGAMSDAEAIDEVIYELLFIREAVNFAYILTDSEKLETAEGVAIYLVGITENEFLIQAVKWGLVGLWVYVESLLDIRTLFAGERLLPLKTKEYWTSDLTNLSECFDGFLRTKDCSYGMGYQQYLRILLLTKLKPSIAYRALDVMQATVRLCEGYESYQIETATIAATLTIGYQYSTIFLGMDVLTAGQKKTYSRKSTAQYSYLEPE